MGPDYSKILKNFSDDLQKRAERAVKRVTEETMKDWLEIIEQRAHDLFKQSVRQFYDSYEPEYYVRYYSLYNLLRSESGDDYLDLWFEPEEMSSFRNGYDGENGLYDQVFRKGWHGGAASGTYSNHYVADGNDSGMVIIKDPHPHPGIPYYRYPYPFYGYWGRPAVIAGVSPLDYFKTVYEDYQKTQIKSDYYIAWDKHAGDVMKYMQSGR